MTFGHNHLPAYPEFTFTQRVIRTVGAMAVVVGLAACSPESDSEAQQQPEGSATADVTPLETQSPAQSPEPEPVETTPAESNLEAEFSTEPIEVLGKWRVTFGELQDDAFEILRSLRASDGEAYTDVEAPEGDIFVALPMEVESVGDASAFDFWLQNNIFVVHANRIDDNYEQDFGAGGVEWLAAPEPNDDVYSTMLVLNVNEEAFKAGKIAIEIFDSRTLALDNPPEPEYDAFYYPVSE